MITKKEYEKALKIVKAYEKQKSRKGAVTSSSAYKKLINKN